MLNANPVPRSATFRRDGEKADPYHKSGKKARSSVATRGGPSGFQEWNDMPACLKACRRCVSCGEQFFHGRADGLRATAVGPACIRITQGHHSERGIGQPTRRSRAVLITWEDCCCSKRIRAEHLCGDWSIFRPIDCPFHWTCKPKTWTCPLSLRPGGTLRQCIIDALRNAFRTTPSEGEALTCSHGISGLQPAASLRF